MYLKGSQRAAYNNKKSLLLALKTIFYRSLATLAANDAKIAADFPFLLFSEILMTQAKTIQDPVILDGHDLPAYCPNPNMPLWSSHPKVALDVSHGATACPYCGTVYQLKAGVVLKAH